jgi:hypothetical protein
MGPKVMITTARIVDTSNAGLWIDVGPDCIDLTPGDKYSAMEHHRRKIVARKRINRNTMVFLVTKGHHVIAGWTVSFQENSTAMLSDSYAPPFDLKPTKALPSTA